MAAGEAYRDTSQAHTQASNGEGISDPEHLAVVGMGASSGGIRALQTFFEALPPDPDIVFVVVMHLAPDRESALPQVLQAYTAMPVQQVTERVQIAPNHVYVIPPNQHIKIADGHLEVSDFGEPRWQRAPIDVFFRTLANVHPDSIGILLSGSGSDGTVGLQAIKEYGGITMVQLPEEAEFDIMPRSAIATGMVDFVLPVAELAVKVVELRHHRMPSTVQADPETLPEHDTDILRRILVRLQASTGHDFSGYKHSTVLRRIERRMRVTQVESHAAYLRYLSQTPHEAQALLKDLLISVTYFFRDPAAFDILQAQVIPKLFEDNAAEEGIRVWVPGCATGEEAYSIAMLLLEQASAAETGPDIQIFASDPDEDALAFGREGLYPAAIAADVSEARLQRFFVQEGAYYRVRKELRDMILFAAHSLLKDPPFSQLDLISCRNLLIYFQRDLQEKVCRLFHYALKPHGYLFLGSAESIESASSLFHDVDKAHRIYRRVPSSHSPARLPDLPLGTEVLGRLSRSHARVLSPHQEASNTEQHRQALERYAPPSLLVDADATIVHISESASRYLQFSAGTPSLNLIRTILPELRLELRTALFRAMERNLPTTTVQIPVDIRGQRRLVQLVVTPNEYGQALVIFLDTAAPEPGTPRADSPGFDMNDPQLRQMEEELETTKAQLQGALESAETQQEELKAANEELQSINEEYRSTLEELETSKEELQSINEELKTVNQELKDKVADLSHANNNLQNLMASAEVATLFVDRQLTIRLYTPSLTQIFNIMPVDEGRPLAHVTHRLLYEDLVRDIQQVLNTLVPIEREVSEINERHYLMRLRPYRTADDHIDGAVITFVDITNLKRVEQQVRKSEAQLRALIEVSAQIVWTTDAAGVMVEDSPSWRAFTGQAPDEWLGGGWLDAVHPEDREHAEATWRQAMASVTPLDTEFRLRHVSGGWRWTAVRAVPLTNPEGVVYGWVGMNADITERKQTQEALQRLMESLEQRVAERTGELEQAHDHLRGEMAERQRMQEALFQREKLAALGLLLANVAHELNNPLAVATMEIENLTEAWPADPDTDNLDTLRQAVERCSSVVQSFLTLARQESMTRSPVALNTLLDEVLILLQHGLEADGIVLALHLDKSLPQLQADANQLHHVISNLITNAHQALRQSEPPRQLTLTTSVNAAGTEVTLEVADTGHGIPADLQRRIFEPFFTTRPQDGGSGLGLSLCRSIIEGHGGAIHLSSQVEQGTTVYVTLPVDDSDVQAQELPTSTEVSEPARHGRVLLIDDEPTVRRALRRLLQRSGHDIVLAANGQEGLEAIREGAYDVILCDIRMPGLDGPGLYRELEQHYPHLLSRMIFLTGDVLSPEARDFFEQVDCLRLIKPFQAREVRRLVQQVLAAQ